MLMYCVYTPLPQRPLPRPAIARDALCRDTEKEKARLAGLFCVWGLIGLKMRRHPVACGTRPPSHGIQLVRFAFKQTPYYAAEKHVWEYQIQ